ncbi:type I polyketide synthase [Spirillospora sp. CA-294931]|uniref:type I polyketide synthase n=1 Tax=Spirillospora sp. CA-294931 TaxID=3240042 RepID=UPI003D938880
MTDPNEHAEADGENAFLAVVGMSCRFPGAGDVDRFWDNLINGRDTVTRLPERTDASGHAYVPAGGFVQDAEWFDADYFGVSPREARILDPQHRIMLECAVEALESAGCDPARNPGVIGMYAGGGDTSYAAVLTARRDRLPSVTDWEIRLATGTDFLCSRVAYKLGLRGPAVTVRAACATSLVAVHLAGQGLLAGDCDLALAGGAAIHVPGEPGHYTEGGILAADGTCRTFDAAASGMVGGDGACVVVLKRLPEALADRDPIHAVIRGSAVNNDGSDRIGYTAPSVEGQSAAIRTAQLIAGVDAETITYVEAHGTATPLGDPIEVAALTRAFRSSTTKRGFCGLGSVKTNIGHTDAAAGGAGLIKTVLALEHGRIPPSLHFTEPNPEIDFAASPFEVVTEPRDWRPVKFPRRAGVSSFGMGGTNAHMVLEEPPEPHASVPARPWQLLPLSARTPTALDAMTGRLAAHLRERPDLCLADVAWTLQTGRREHPVRRFAVVRDLEDAVRVLGGAAPEQLVTSGGLPQARPVAFRFPGPPGRSDHTEPEFRRAVEECRGHITPGDEDVDAFVHAYALARLWISWGVRPATALGTGVGSLVAATVTGALPLPKALRLVAEGARPCEESEAADPAHLVVEIGPADRPSMLATAGRLWLAGVTLTWTGVHDGEPRSRVRLPTYPFERRRYLVDLDDPHLDETSPADDVQQVVAGLFAEFLGLPVVDPDDSFFDLGGDSLIATQLLVRARKLFPVELVLRSMFEAPTASAFAALIEDRMAVR